MCYRCQVCALFNHRSAQLTVQKLRTWGLEKGKELIRYCQKHVILVPGGGGVLPYENDGGAC